MQTSTFSKGAWTITALLLTWLASALVRVENERYALFLGMCRSESVVGIQMDFACLADVETRTGWLWHLYWALFP